MNHQCETLEAETDRWEFRRPGGGNQTQTQLFVPGASLKFGIIPLQGVAPLILEQEWSDPTLPVPALDGGSHNPGPPHPLHPVPPLDGSD